MNSVSLIGTLTGDPELRRSRTGGDVCLMRIAVPRRRRSGRRESGVVYVEVAAYGADARESAERLKQGDTLGLSGRIDRDDRRGRGAVPLSASSIRRRAGDHQQERRVLPLASACGSASPGHLRAARGQDGADRCSVRQVVGHLRELRQRADTREAAPDQPEVERRDAEPHKRGPQGGPPPR